MIELLGIYKYFFVCDRIIFMHSGVVVRPQDCITTRGCIIMMKPMSYSLLLQRLESGDRSVIIDMLFLLFL